MIRIAHDTDAPALLTIYAPAVTDSAISFETELPTVAAMGERVRVRLSHYPWLVWEEAGEVLGYAYAARFRDRAAYDWIAETSVYVHAKARRRGLARRLYQALLEAMRQQGIRQAVGVITLPGEASVRLHEQLGFTQTGVWRQSGYKLAQWWDVGIWQKTLSRETAPPLPIRDFPALPPQELAAALQGISQS